MERAGRTEMLDQLAQMVGREIQVVKIPRPFVELAPNPPEGLLELQHAEGREALADCPVWGLAQDQRADPALAERREDPARPAVVALRAMEFPGPTARMEAMEPMASPGH